MGPARRTTATSMGPVVWCNSPRRPSSPATPGPPATRWCLRAFPPPEGRHDGTGLPLGTPVVAPARRHRLEPAGRDDGELRFAEGTVTPMLPSEYFARNCWLGVSQPRGRTQRSEHSCPPTASCGATTIPTTRVPTRSPGRPSDRSSTVSPRRDGDGSILACRRRSLRLHLEALAPYADHTARRWPSCPNRSPTCRQTRIKPSASPRPAERAVTAPGAGSPRRCQRASCPNRRPGTHAERQIA